MMSNQQDPNVISQQAERDLNSQAAKTGHQGSTSSMILNLYHLWLCSCSVVISLLAVASA